MACANLLYSLVFMNTANTKRFVNFMNAMNAMNAILISDAQGAAKNIERFQSEAADLLHRLAQFRAWYAVKGPKGEWLFGPSKFIGYEDLDASSYSQLEGRMDGRDTETTLQQWFEEEPEDTAVGRELHSQLAHFLGQFGKKKNSKTRINLLAIPIESDPDNQLEMKVVELIDTVSKLLSPSSRAELRKRLA